MFDRDVHYPTAVASYDDEGVGELLTAAADDGDGDDDDDDGE
jgi:hypothetical protein